MIAGRWERSCLPAKYSVNPNELSSKPSVKSAKIQQKFGKMPTNCVVGGCSRTSDDKSASFYGFPSKTKHASRRNKWIQFVRSTRKDFTGPGTSHNNNVKICDAHFDDDAFMRRFQLTEGWRAEGKFSSKFARKLVENAVPTKALMKARIGKTPTRGISGQPRRRLPSTYTQKSDMRARTHVSTETDLVSFSMFCSI